MLEFLLKSGSEVKVLGVVLFEDGLHLRGVAAKAGVSPCEAKRELDNLTALGVLARERKGNLVLFKANAACPFLAELRGLYLKTEGVLGGLAAALENAKGVEYAFVYGSFANGTYGEKSDVDVLVVGDAGDDALAAAFGRLQKRANREINWIHWTPGELPAKARGGFFKNASKKRLWLKGDEREFIQTIKARINKR
ncbi:MAG: nucleotidyltransferase domain-containing protein [Candidatus Micrarchaeia archaeon]